MSKLDADELDMCNMLGISPAAYRDIKDRFFAKTNPAAAINLPE
jgi:hypothetical protein